MKEGDLELEEMSLTFKSSNLVTPLIDKKDKSNESDVERPHKSRESIYTIPSIITGDIVLPKNLFNEKTKPFKHSYQEKMYDLIMTDRVFVKKSSKPLIKYIDSNCQFEILNKFGQPILWAIDTTDAWTSMVLEGVKPFNVMILDDAYEEMFKIDGQPGLNRFQGTATVTHNNKCIGKIVQEDSFCSFTPTYHIESETGSIALKVVGPENAFSIGMPESPVFNVYLTDDVTFVGRIARQWLMFGAHDAKPGDEMKPEETYVLTFHPDMDLKTKMLLTANLFMLDFQFYHKAVGGSITTSCWIWFFSLFFVLVSMILIGIYLIKSMQQSN